MFFDWLYNIFSTPFQSQIKVYYLVLLPGHTYISENKILITKAIISGLLFKGFQFSQSKLKETEVDNKELVFTDDKKEWAYLIE